MHVTMANSKREALLNETQLQESVDATVAQRLSESPRAPSFNKVTWSYDSGTLRLKGSVQSFYLKQCLQTRLKNLVHVNQIVNDVDVV